MSNRPVRPIAVALVVLSLSGCTLPDEPVSTSQTDTVDEETQGVGSAYKTIGDFCEPVHEEGARTPTHVQALAAVRRVVNYVIRHNDDADYDAVIGNRRDLVDVSAYLEDRRCMTGLVPRIDRVLRKLAIPDVPDDYFMLDDTYDEDPPDGR